MKSGPEMKNFSEEKAPVAVTNYLLRRHLMENLNSSPVPKTVFMRSARAFNLPEHLDSIDPDYAKTVSLDKLTIFMPNQRVVVLVSCM